MKTFDIVVAADAQLGIGLGGTLPWQLPGDMAYFKRLTSTVSDSSKRNAVIMGRKTWESIPVKFRPLSKRLNIVLTRDADYRLDDSVLIAHSLDRSLELACQHEIESVFVIGGAQLFTQALVHPACARVYFTDIKNTFTCDTFLPEFGQLFEHAAVCDSEVQQDNGIQYVFKVYERKGSGVLDCSPHSVARKQ